MKQFTDDEFNSVPQEMKHRYEIRIVEDYRQYSAGLAQGRRANAGQVPEYPRLQVKFIGFWSMVQWYEAVE